MPAARSPSSVQYAMGSWNAVIQSHVDDRNKNYDELKNTGCLRSFVFLV